MAEATGAAGYYDNARPEIVALVPAAGARVLDVGCAAGAMGEALKARGACEVVGIERVESAAAVARTRLDAVHVVDLEQLPPLPYPDGHFDVITFADVLEHLVDPLAVLRHLRRYLRPGGHILCSIPNVRHEGVVLRLLVEGRWTYGDAGVLDRTHLRFFTLDEMLLLLHAAGFVLAAVPVAASTAPSPHLDAAAALVGALGGDVARFREEAVVLQYLLLARTVEPGAVHDPWDGCRRVRLLLAPDWDDAADRWEHALAVVCCGIGGDAPVTVGVVLPAAGPAALPPAFVDVVRGVPADVALLQRPADDAAWQRLVAGAAMVVQTGAQPTLVQCARRAGVELFDGRR